MVFGGPGQYCTRLPEGSAGVGEYPTVYLDQFERVSFGEGLGAAVHI